MQCRELGASCASDFVQNQVQESKTRRIPLSFAEIVENIAKAPPADASKHRRFLRLIEILTDKIRYAYS